MVLKVLKVRLVLKDPLVVLKVLLVQLVLKVLLVQ